MRAESFDILRKCKSYPLPLGQIVQSRLGPDEIREYVKISKLNPNLFTDKALATPLPGSAVRNILRKEVRVLDIFQRQPAAHYQLQLEVSFYNKTGRLSIMGAMFGLFPFGSDFLLYDFMERKTLISLTPKENKNLRAARDVLFLPGEDVFLALCQLQPKFVDIFNTFLALPSTEEN